MEKKEGDDFYVMTWEKKLVIMDNFNNNYIKKSKKYLKKIYIYRYINIIIIIYWYKT